MNDAHNHDGTIESEIARRNVSEVLHFTTGRGLVGVLASRALTARSHLLKDAYLEHIYRPNSRYRREDPRYWRYVNLSVTNPNLRFFKTSQGWWKGDSDLFWVVLSLNTEILTHDGVLFATSNMAYDGVVPAAGASGFSNLFSDRVPCGFGSLRARRENMPLNVPTDPQAEVLYPDTLSLDWITRIYVANEQDFSHAHGILGSFDYSIDVAVRADMFD